MRVCLNPRGCPFVAPPRSLAEDLAHWERLLTAVLPGDGALARLLVGDIARLSVPAT